MKANTNKTDNDNDHRLETHDVEVKKGTRKRKKGVGDRKDDKGMRGISKQKKTGEEEYKAKKKKTKHL